MRSFKYFLLFMVTGLFFGLLAQAQTQTPVFPDATATDPKTLGWMQGFPPAPDKTIRFDNASHYRFPGWRWSFSNLRELVPTKNVWRGDGPVVRLPRAERNLDGTPFTDMTGKPMTCGESLARNYTDGVLVMHKGKVVYEKYFGVLEPQKPHLAFSVTKSFVGTLAAMLVEEGKLDPAALVTKYIPELKGTAYDDATVRQVMDMTVGVQYSENYADPKAEVWDYARAGGMFPAGPNYQGPKTYYEFLVKLRKRATMTRLLAIKPSMPKSWPGLSSGCQASH
jgi:hypothetical protein